MTLIPSAITQADADELRRLDYCLRTNASISHDSAAIAHLIKLGLAHPDGIAVRITELGYQVLPHLP